MSLGKEALFLKMIEVVGVLVVVGVVVVVVVVAGRKVTSYSLLWSLLWWLSLWSLLEREATS